MYRKIVRFYVFMLTLLEISLNSKLTAQGKSHGVIHDSLITEGINFQEWGAADPGGGGGGAVVSVSPAALRFGRAALGAAHALTVTVTNTHNSTLHLASVAGTTPDFHASFFDAKSLPPAGNTTFSVVYVGRREGAVAAHLYIHTSLGVHKYPVSAVGTASEWGAWPLVELSVPHNATVAPLLTLTNPTDHAVQVTSVYSSAPWLGLELPGGGAWAARALWTLPPRAAAVLARLRVAPPPPPPPPASGPAPGANKRLTGYIRIKTDAPSAPVLIVCVEARGAAAGAHADPPHLRAGVRGAADPAHTFSISLGNSAAAAVSLAPPAPALPHCAPLAAAAPPPGPPPALPATHNGGTAGAAAGAAASAGAVRVELLADRVEAYSDLKEVATVTMDWRAMWAHYMSAGAAGEAAAVTAAGEGGVLCAGSVRLGGVAVPYSVTLLPGTLHVDDLHFVTASQSAGVERAVRTRNEFRAPLHLARLDVHPDIDNYFERSTFTPRVLGAGERATLVTLRLRRGAAAPAAGEWRMTLHTNVTQYSVPVRLYSGLVDMEWQWPAGAWSAGAEGAVRVGAVPAGGARAVPLRLRNAAPAQLCVLELAADRAAVTLEYTDGCAGLQECCIPAGGSASALLTVSAPAAEGALTAAVWARTAHGAARATLTADVFAGDVTIPPITIEGCAPLVWCAAPLRAHSSMAMRMRTSSVRAPAEPALTHDGGGSGEISQGVSSLGNIVFAAELSTSPPHYAAAPGNTTDSEAAGAEWLRRALTEDPWPAVVAELSRTAARRALYRGLNDRNYTLLVTTTQVVQIPVAVTVRFAWPRLLQPSPGPAGAAAGAAGLVGVGAATTLRLRVHNPSRERALLLHAVLAGVHHLVGDEAHASWPAASASCSADASCVSSARGFNMSGWRALSGDVSSAAAGAGDVTVLRLAARAAAELSVTFAPHAAALHTAALYLRNNLTGVEAVPLWGRGAEPSFELNGRKPGSTLPLLFEVSEVGAEGAVPVSRALVLRNTGGVPVELRALLVAGAPCHAHGFHVRSCHEHARATLQPNTTRRIEVLFSADCTLSVVRRALTLVTSRGHAGFVLGGGVPARVLADCAARTPPPPHAARAALAASAAALLLAAAALAAAALDAEHVLRRARAHMQRDRAPPTPAAPLDLRSLNTQPAPLTPPAPAPAAPPAASPALKRRRTKKKELFAWKLTATSLQADADRADKLMEDDSSRSSTEESEHNEREHEHENECEQYDERADTAAGEEAEVGEGEDEARRASDEDAASVGSDSTDADEREREATPPRHGAGDASPAAAEAAPTADVQRAARARREHVTPTRRHDTAPRAAAAERLYEEAARPRAVPPPLAAAAAASVPIKHHKRDKPASKRGRGCGAGAGAAPRAEHPPAAAAAPPAPPAASSVRRGATFSSVVAAPRAEPPPPPPAAAAATAAHRPPPPPPPAPRLAPIGSDVRARRAAADNSLFYFNGGCAAAAEHAVAAASADRERVQWEPPRRAPSQHGGGYIDDNSMLQYNTSELASSLWGGGGGGGWGWGGYSLRPPPGFAAPPAAAPAPPPTPPLARDYDPFRSIAALWAPELQHPPAPAAAPAPPGPASAARQHDDQYTH